MEWGSDAFAATLRELGFEYVALVPGSSLAGLHDSLVNVLDDRDPKMLVCLHEEHSIAIAHGFAKVTDRPLLVLLHSNVGLMHAAMAYYNAWCDRVPMVTIGATGPLDAKKRRPWIDWIHTSRDQAALVRAYTKWDDQPGSVPAAVESIVRAKQYATTAPCGPTYVVLDMELQERKLDAPLALPDVTRFAAPQPAAPTAADVERVATLLREAKRPFIAMGRCTRDVAAWDRRVELAERLNARVVTDLKVGAAFPTDHPLHVGLPAVRLTPAQIAVAKEADVILALDMMDLGGLLHGAFAHGPVTATVINCSLDRYVHNGWSLDHQMPAPVDVDLVADHGELVRALLAIIPPAVDTAPFVRLPAPSVPAHAGEMGIASFSAGLEEAFAQTEHCYIRIPLGSNGGARFTFRHPLDYLGADGGAGVGAGPGQAVGSALGLRGTTRLPVAVLGDGDYLMGVTALWTAVAYKIPLLVIVANNRCYYNDVVAQERIAITRGRPVERKWVGQMLDEPAPDIAGFARAQGATGIGPIADRAQLATALAEAVEIVRAGGVCVVDVLVAAEYDNAQVAVG